MVSFLFSLLRSLLPIGKNASLCMTGGVVSREVLGEALVYQVLVLVGLYFRLPMLVFSFIHDVRFGSGAIISFAGILIGPSLDPSWAGFTDAESDLLKGDTALIYLPLCALWFSIFWALYSKTRQYTQLPTQRGLIMEVLAMYAVAVRRAFGTRRG